MGALTAQGLVLISFAAEELARAVSERGELVLRRRTDDGALELRVNGVFVMDDRETSSEALLASAALSSVPLPARVLVGGLGLGYTVRALLLDHRVEQIVVAEIEPDLVGWMRSGLVPSVLEDPRVSVEVGDVRDVIVAQGTESLDAILLDVDNGPDFLVYEGNSAIYAAPFLSSCAERLRTGGVLSVWSSSRSPALEAEVTAVFGKCDVVPVPVRLQGRDERYYVCQGRVRFLLDESPGEHTGVGVTDEFRIERDTMGEVKVPRDALWRAQTQRAVENFPLSGQPLPPALVHALARIKASAAVVNAELGVLSAERAGAIAAAADRVAAGEYDAEFPIDVFQTGSGTSTNMNVNEVLATLATRELGDDVHPNDHVNASQSSNDTFPSAIHVAATEGVVRELLPALDHLAGSLERKAAEFAEVVKSGRTHLMDATPVTLGQEFAGYATQIRRGAERVTAVLPRVSELPLGGTAVGTGINTPPGFAAKVIAELNRRTGLELTEAVDHFEAQGARDGLVELSGQLKTIAVSLTKICNDLRWMGSGPRAGLGEIALPDLQPGSSIMPGKVNPVICEATLMVAAQVIGNDTTITVAGAAGNFELNVMLPVIARNLLESIQLLANSSRLLADRCVDGITANVDHARALAESSPSIVTPLNRYLGYENAAAVAKQALKEGKTIRAVVIERGYVDDGSLTEEQLDAALDVLSMTRPARG